MSSEAPNRRLAVLIDAENAQPHLIRPILLKAREYGLLIVRRVYGDWSMPSMTGWKEVIIRYGLETRQQFHYVKGKNHADMAMTIDAMDLLYSGKVNGFCLISSDSDFTPLAARVRHENLFVMGIGRPQTSDGFVHACNVFIKTNAFAPPDQPPVLPPLIVQTTPQPKAVAKPTPAEAAPQPKAVAKPTPVKAIPQPKAATKPVPVKATPQPKAVAKPAPAKVTPQPRQPIPDSVKITFREAFEQLSGPENVFVTLSEFGSRVRQLSPDFSPKKYGYAKFSGLIQTLNLLIEMKRDPETKAHQVRWRRPKAKGGQAK